LAALDSGNNIYLKGIYALHEPVYNVVVQNDSILSMEAADKLHEYNTTTSLFAKKSADTVSLEFLSKVYANSKDILIYLQEDSSQLLFKDQYGKPAGHFKHKVVDNVDEAADVTISPDMKYVYIEGSVYNIASGDLIGSIKTSYEVDEKDDTKKEKKYVEVSALTFFAGNKLTAGFSDGSIRTYEVIAEGKNKLLEIDSLYIENIEVDVENTITSADFNIDGNKITALNADRSGKYLYVNTQFNSVLIYDFQKSAIINRKDTIGNAKEDKDKDKHTKNFATEIKGHSSQIVTVSISPDNRFLLTGSYDHYLILWDATDVYNLVKVADFRSPYEEKLVNTWLLDDNNIFTLSEDDQLYWWKVEKPADLYKSNQLYRFSTFIYGLNLMNEAKYNTVPDPVTTKEQYHRLVNYLITIPGENPFPGDKTYNTLLEKAQPEITAMYNRLSSMPDYKSEIPEENRLILENFFIKIINILPGLSDVRKDILATKYKMPEFIADIDTTPGKSLFASIMNSFFFRTADKYLEKKGDYPAAYTYMWYTRDSILPLLLPKYQQKDKDLLLSLLDYRFIRYCIYTSRYDSAISIADASAKRSVFKTKNFNYYKVATYLAAGRYDDAKALFIKTESEKGNGNKSYLKSILRKLLTKNIRTDDITRFMKETDLGKELE
jgi:WD40 repeat protein